MRLTDANKPVSVCFVIDRLSRAGTETQLLALLARLNRRVVRPSLCLLNGGESQLQFAVPADCPVLDLRLHRLASPAAFFAASRLASFWRQNRVEVVQTYFLDSTYFAAPLARLCGIARVVRVRNNLGYWLTRWHQAIGRLTGHFATTLTNSEFGRAALLKAERLHPDRVIVIENGVDLERFPEPEPVDTGKSIVRIGAVANLRAVKNLDSLIRVATVICRDYPKARFEIAGDGPERAALISQARSAGIADRFRFHGAISDISAFLAELEIAVLVSRSESMSNALLEYMAAGRAIVATDVGANSRLVRHNREGIIVPPRNDGAVCDAIRLLLDCPNLAEKYGAAARVRVQASFSRDSMVKRFEDFYKRLIRQSDRRHCPTERMSA